MALIIVILSRVDVLLCRSATALFFRLPIRRAERLLSTTIFRVRVKRKRRSCAKFYRVRLLPADGFAKTVLLFLQTLCERRPYLFSSPVFLPAILSLRPAYMISTRVSPYQ